MAPTSSSVSATTHPLSRALAALTLAAATLFLSACGGGGGPAYSRATSYGAQGEAARGSVASNEVPGLGTEAGRFRKSKVQVGAFVRERQKDPLEVVALYYNSEEGLQATLRTPVLPKGRAKFTSPRGYIEYGLTTPRGKPLPGFEAAGRKFVEGESGDRYALYVRNMTDTRMEVVMSVDGLDVLDRGPASFEKRGYILEPGDKLLVPGFRHSTASIQEFRFGSVARSLASRQYGPSGAANAGVVGFAIFPESKTQPYGYRTGDIQRRDMANPFPQDL